MPRRLSKVLSWIYLISIFALVSSCGLQRSRSDVVASTPQSSQTPSLPTVALTFAPTIIAATPLPIESLTAVVSPTPTLPTITITAVNGNIFIRRGPSLAYNPISVLEKGEKAFVLAHDILSDWLEITIPSLPGKTGWVSLHTGFSTIAGNLNDLPAIQVTDWPVAAYLRNCTYHEMIAKPGDIILPSLLEYPENEVWVNPGSYTLYDLNIADYPEVTRVQLKEGLEIDIRIDGNGEKRKCP